jgi:hypothetical protein
VRRVAAIVLPALFLVWSPGIATADLAGLHVDGPPGAWRASNSFYAEWDELSDDPIGYRFLNTPWAPQSQWQHGPYNRMQIAIPVPPGATDPPPGEYLVEMWLWSNGVNNPPGPSSYLTLRFDASTPTPPRVAAPPSWVDGRSPIQLSIDPAAPPLPPSGIRGYAVSVSADAGESPCAAAKRCTDAELDLPGGAGPRKLVAGPLPQGTSYVNVVAVSGTGIASPPASVPVHVDATPPAIRFTGIPADWVDHPVAVGAIAEDALSGMAPAGAAGPFTALAIDGGLPTLAFGQVVDATVSGEGAHLVTAWARDGLGNALGPEGAPAATVRIDETPPLVTFSGAQRPDDPEQIEVSVSDPMSGANPDRGSIEVRPAATTQRFQALPTRTTGNSLLARWNSDDFPPGSYEFRATGFDAAGNPAQTVSRVDGTPMVLRNPIKVPTAIESGFGGAKLVWQHCHRVDGGRQCQRETVTDFDSRPAVWTVPYRRPLRFGGVLHSTAGAALAGFPVEVVETFAPGADAAQRRTTVISRPDGRFDTRLAAGPSRRVEAFFPGTRTLTRSVGRPVTMAVRAGIRFRASTSAARIGGEPMIFSGRLLADEAAIPRTGRPIQLQFRVPGGTWTEFRTVQTDRSGRFRYPYAFTDDDSRGIRFQFRAASPEQAGWPYRPAASAPVSVTGY